MELIPNCGIDPVEYQTKTRIREEDKSLNEREAEFERQEEEMKELNSYINLGTFTIVFHPIYKT